VLSHTVSVPGNAFGSLNDGKLPRQRSFYIKYGMGPLSDLIDLPALLRNRLKLAETAHGTD
jgi:hypothetical protein